MDLLAVAPLSIAAPWLAAADLDVMRLPNRTCCPQPSRPSPVLLPKRGRPPAGRLWPSSLVGMVVAGGLFATVEALKGGISYGDMKLAGMIAAAIAGHSITAM